MGPNVDRCISALRTPMCPKKVEASSFCGGTESVCNTFVVDAGLVEVLWLCGMSSMHASMAQ